MARRKNNNTAAVAAAAAAAAVNAARGDSNVVNFTLPDDDDDEPGLTSDLLEDLEKIDEDHGGGISWELYCDAPGDKIGQIAKLARSELRSLRDRCIEYGPGEYHVVARAANGLFVKNTRRSIKISGFARGANPPASSTPAIDPISIMAQMEERMERRRLQHSRERMEQIKFWAPILAPIGVEMAKGLFGRSGGGESIKELVAAMVGMKDLVGSPGDKSVDTLLKGIELAQSFAPEGPSKGSTWSDVVVNGLRELRPLAETLAQRRQPGAPAPISATPQLKFTPTPPAAAASAAATPSAAAAPAGSSPPAEADEMFKLFEPLLHKLAAELEEYAVNAADPGLAAEALMVKIPRLVKAQISHDQLKGWLTDPNWWPILAEFHTGLQPYHAFCDQVREEVLAILEGPENGDAGATDEPESA